MYRNGSIGCKFIAFVLDTKSTVYCFIFDKQEKLKS